MGNTWEKSVYLLLNSPTKILRDPKIRGYDDLETRTAELETERYWTEQDLRLDRISHQQFCIEMARSFYGCELLRLDALTIGELIFAVLGRITMFTFLDKRGRSHRWQPRGLLEKINFEPQHLCKQQLFSSTHLTSTRSCKIRPATMSQDSSHSQLPASIPPPQSRTTPAPPTRQTTFQEKVAFFVASSEHYIDVKGFIEKHYQENRAFAENWLVGILIHILHAQRLRISCSLISKYLIHRQGH